MLQEITEKIFSGIRITSEEGLWLLREAELLDLAPLADFWRQKHNPNKDVSYVSTRTLTTPIYVTLIALFVRFTEQIPTIRLPTLIPLNRSWTKSNALVKTGLEPC